MEPYRIELGIRQGKQTCFRGSAKVKLKHIHFEEDHVPGARQLDVKNVARLKKVFELEGCMRLDEEHHVPAVIEESVLSHALNGRDSPTTLLGLTEPPQLSFPAEIRLRCLHGKHRIHAAKEHLLPGDQWWVVDLYVADLPQGVESDLREEYSNARNFGDGDIFRNIRYHQMRNNAHGERKWRARLSESKRKDLKQFQKIATNKPALSQAFDALLPYVGLWSSLQLGTFHRILTLRCPEELANYLQHVHRIWREITLDDPGLQRFVDARTVDLLQLRSPIASEDHTSITNMMDSGQLFPSIRSRGIRTQILTRIHAITCVIPSLFTFFEDTKYLEPCATILKAALAKKFGESVREAIQRCYTGHNQQDRVVIYETSANTMSTTVNTEQFGIDLGYRQLWLFAMRNFPEMTGVMPRKDPGESKPAFNGTREKYWHRFAELANSLGFESDRLRQMRSDDPDRKAARAFVRRMKPIEEYDLDESSLEAATTHLCEYMMHIKRRPLRSPICALTTNAQGEPLASRCNRPFNSSHRRDRGRLYIRELSIEYSYHGEARLTSFAVKRDIFHAFFGKSENFITPQSSPADSEFDRLAETHANATIGNGLFMDVEPDPTPPLAIEPVPAPTSGLASEHEPQAMEQDPQPTEQTAPTMTIEYGMRCGFLASDSTPESVHEQLVQAEMMIFLEESTRKYFEVPKGSVTEDMFRSAATALTSNYCLAIVQDGNRKTTSVERIWKKLQTSDFPRVVLLGAKGSKQAAELFQRKGR
ncbi:MAG: hypothetical protein M1833_004270 [Piccolia ochrophora]|nr:MAG: hypothetical protein M1833_004270 [Piccolia ochrophora]